MTKRAANKIMNGLREALAIARGESQPARVSHFMECHDCGDLVRVAAKCPECGARLYAPSPAT